MPVAARTTTLRSIADAASVSHATVSMVLNGRGDACRIPPRTQQRILRIARDRGYRANPLARGLRGLRTQSAAVIWSWGVPAQVGEAVRLMAVRFQAHGYSTHAVDSLGRLDIVRQSLADCVQRSVDLVVLHAVAGMEDDDGIQGLLARLPAVVLVDHQSTSQRYDAVLSEVGSAAREIAGHLCRTGRRSILLLDTPHDLSRKADALQQALQAEGGGHVRISALTLARQGPDAEADWFVAALRAGLNEHAGADAICCFNDVTALATMSHLQAQGLRVPTDVAVVGFGDSEMAPYTTPPLASVSRCFERVAEQAAHLGLTRLRGQADAPRIVRVPARFVCRESAGRLEQTPAVSPTVHHPVPGIPSLES